MDTIEQYHQILRQLKEIREEQERATKKANLNEPYFDLTDAVELLHMSRRTISGHIAAGRLGHAKIGLKYFFSASDLEKFIQDHHVNPKSKSE